MNAEVFHNKIIEQIKQRWLELVNQYATKTLKMFKSMQEFQAQREEILLLDVILEKLYQAECYFKYYKPTKNPVYEHPFDNTCSPLGNHTDILKREFEEIVSWRMKDEINDLEIDEYYFTGSPVSDYVRSLTEYWTLKGNIFPIRSNRKTNEPSFSSYEKGLIDFYNFHIQKTPQKLIEDEFEETSEVLTKMSEDAYQKRRSEKDRACYEYADKLKRMIFCIKQVSDLRYELQKDHFLALCIMQGINQEDNFLFENFHKYVENGDYNEYWWKNNPFEVKSSDILFVSNKEFIGFTEMLKLKFKDELERLNSISDENSKMEYDYLFGLTNYKSILDCLP